MESCLVVNRDLLAGFDISQRDKENVIVENLHERVRRTGMINVVRSIATAATIQTPTSVDLTDPKSLSVGSASRFRI